MLKRILASLAIVSLLLAGVLLVCWWRSNNGHLDSFTLGTKGSTQSHFMSNKGRIALEVTDHQGALVTSRMEFYRFQDVIAWCLLIPALWVAIKIRSLLPRPGKRIQN